MSIPEDEQLERYLKRFRPLVPEPLPDTEQKRVIRRPFTLVALAGALACVLGVALGLYFHARPTHSRASTDQTATVEKGREPLTIRCANALLAESPSVKSALDGMAFHSLSTQLRNGQCSALDVLGEERNKL